MKYAENGLEYHIGPWRQAKFPSAAIGHIGVFPTISVPSYCVCNCLDSLTMTIWPMRRLRFQVRAVLRMNNPNEGPG
jgi:hypothetical protein